VDDTPTRIWTLTRDDEEAVCQVRLAPHGIEVDLLRKGKLVLTRVFETDEEAMAWARQKRATREAQGWTVSVETPEHQPGRVS
jgi:hypothetical protein